MQTIENLERERFLRKAQEYARTDTCDPYRMIPVEACLGIGGTEGEMALCLDMQRNP
jgi:hypothetical protein